MLCGDLTLVIGLEARGGGGLVQEGDIVRGMLLRWDLHLWFLSRGGYFQGCRASLNGQMIQVNMEIQDFQVQPPKCPYPRT